MGVKGAAPRAGRESILVLAWSNKWLLGDGGGFRGFDEDKHRAEGTFIILSSSSKVAIFAMYTS